MSTNVAFALAVGGLSLAGCQSGLSLTANQKRGKQIYEGLCDKCHKLIEPTQMSDEVWVAASNKYGTKLKLTRDEINLLVDYLTHANDVKPKD